MLSIESADKETQDLYAEDFFDMLRSIRGSLEKSDMSNHIDEIKVTLGRGWNNQSGDYHYVVVNVVDNSDESLRVLWNRSVAFDHVYRYGPFSMLSTYNDVESCMVRFFDAMAMVYPKKMKYLQRALESEGFSASIAKIESSGMGEAILGSVEKNAVKLDFAIHTGLLAEVMEKEGFDRVSPCEGRDTRGIDEMDGYEFELFCADLLRNNGFSDVEITKGSGDQGIDVLATKDFVKYGFQCKCHSSDIGNKAVQEACAGKSYYGCHVAVVLTNRYFTSAAKELSAQTGVVLWDRDKLLSMIGL